MPERINEYTGKPMPEGSLRKPNGRHCEDCGTELIDNCYICGAPICCPKCCRDVMLAELAARKARQSIGIIKVCAWCKRVEQSDGSWLHDDMLDLYAGEITHGICPECSEALEKQIPNK